MFRRRRHSRHAWIAVLAAVVGTAGCGATDSPQDRPAHTARPVASASVVSDSGTGTPVTAPSGNQDPARFAPQVQAHAGKAGINPQLLMAILYNESYKPHDPAMERAWQQFKPDAAFGIANMHKAAFDDTKRGRDFANRDWQELPDNPDLAIEAAAWYLHDLARQLPATWPGPYTRDELLALGYNAGPGNMKAFAAGAKPADTAQAYLDHLHANWAIAGQAMRSG